MRVLCVSVLVAVLSVFRSAGAHELSMAEMEVRETTAGQFLWQWAATTDRLPGANELTPMWPAGCTAQSRALDCGSRGLSGRLEVRGIGDYFQATLVKVYWLDGRSGIYWLTAAQPTAQLYSLDDPRGRGEIATAYTVLGVEHILTGYDHLMFVISLLFLVGFNRRLLYTITAFTLAHSLTLALAALGLLTLRSPPVEASIALSIMLVAGEALHERPTLARRWPAIVAFLFGLVHGLGFAGALKDIGLPQTHLPAALLTFNVGVELGQLFVVGVAYAAYRAFAGWPKTALARKPALYAIGAVAAYWSLGRVIAILA
jgi:hydrogenase/urease accessory protein HupE